MPEQVMAVAAAGAQIPIWIKILYSLFVAVLVPVYWAKYGVANFIWFSDIALFLGLAAVLLENSLLASIAAVSVVLLELFWNVGFFGRLIAGVDVGGLAKYMFDTQLPRYLRALSLFHVVLPFLLIWLVYRLGYDRRALVAQTLLAWVVLLVTYFFTKPQDNFNWVAGPGRTPQQWMPPVVYLLLLMVLYPLVVYLPTHLLLARFFVKSHLPQAGP